MFGDDHCAMHFSVRGPRSRTFYFGGIDVVCKFRFCVFEKDFQCTLPEIAIGEDGQCILARHIQSEFYNLSPEAEKKRDEYLANFTTSDGRTYLDVYKERYNKDT